MIGTTFGPYEIVEEIGAAGMAAAAVYRANQAALNRQVAIKVLASDLAHTPTFRERFVREMRAVAQLAHPNILPVYNFGEETETGLLYLAMQWVDGGSLARLLGQPLEIEAAVRIVAQIARALDHAHKRGLVHGDVKPSNILLTDDGYPLLADFGIARMAQEAHLARQGTSYTAPEQAQGRAVDHRVDIYALGVVAYELLSGRPPSQADTSAESLHRPDVPKALEKAVMRALAQEPGQRYASAAEFADALEATRAGGGTWRLPWPRLAIRPAWQAGAAPAARVPRARSATPSSPSLPPTPSPSLPATRVEATTLSLGQWLLRTALTLLAVLLAIAVALSILALIAAGMLTEQTIVHQNWRLDEVTLVGVSHYYRRADFEQSLVLTIEPYAPGMLTNIHVDFEPPDKIACSARLRGGDIALQVRVREQAGIPHVQIERFDGVPLYVIGGFLSDRVNSGLAQVWEDAPIRIERLEVSENYLTVVYRNKSGGP